MSNNINSSEDRQGTLDDESRVRVLSPGMLVAKRFFRNRLAMIGLFIIIAMFIFSFAGGFISPYGEAQVFRTVKETMTDYAGASYNEDYKFTMADGQKLPSMAQSKFILATHDGDTTFEAKDQTYTLEKAGNDFYKIYGAGTVAEVTYMRKLYAYKNVDDSFTDTVKAAFEKANNAGQTQFEVNGNQYEITASGRTITVTTQRELAIASKYVFNAYTEGTTLSYDFRYQAEAALNAGQTTFTADGTQYTIAIDSANDRAVVSTADSKQYALLSHFSVSSVNEGSFLSVEYIEAAEEAIASKAAQFSVKDADGKDVTYTLAQKDNQYVIRTYQKTQLNDNYASPSLKHLCGTDGNGMDILTRLMFGGRVSLLIGFVVILIELLIGVVLGGIAGFFGGWVDNIIMRVVDVFYCIPAMPIYIILGSIMDKMKVDPKIRIYFLCVVLGILGWASIARMVRGQILSLREQEFMVAAEATGISTYRRIFMHLIPNVIPQLIVVATMGLGDVILTEATLSFLGLGVKYPYASWGNIINAVNDSYVMSTYWFVWIPAGMLILMTVLGFNFIGDGLRDAFDPKMKR